MDATVYESAMEIRHAVLDLSNEVERLRLELANVTATMRQMVAFQAVALAKPSEKEDIQKIFERFGAALETK